MKKISILLLIVLLLGLAACGTEPVEPTPTPEPTETVQAGETYCFTLEYERLYALKSGESYPTLLLDGRCYVHTRLGEQVAAAFTDGTVRLFDLSDGSSQIIADDPDTWVSAIQLDGEGGAVWCGYTDDEPVLYHWSQGKLTKLDVSLWLNWLFVADGAIIYQDYDSRPGAIQLVALNIDDGTERWRITPDCEQSGMLYRQDGTVYLSCDDARLYTLDSADGSLTALDTPFDAIRYGVLAIGSSGSFLLYDSAHVGNEPSVYYADAGGLRPLEPFPGNDGEAYVTLLDQAGDKVLLRGDRLRENEALKELGEDYCSYSELSYCVIDLSDGSCETIPRPLGENERLFENGDFPVLDSSTARKPVTRDIYRLFCQDGAIPGSVPVCNTTHGAWLAIADKTSDVALLAAPTEEEQAYLDEKGVKVDRKLYGGDAMVFIGNAACGVSDLTLDEVRAIYRGEVRNWSQLGGVNAPIRVFYRDDQSGSERLMQSMLWGGETAPDYGALGFERLAAMSTIVEECLNDPYAIGYSVMTYLGDVYANEELLLFSLGGVQATAENVASGDYPLGTKGYVVIRADEPSDSPARRLFDWFGCSACDEILNNNGVTPMHG